MMSHLFRKLGLRGAKRTRGQLVRRPLRFEQLEARDLLAPLTWSPGIALPAPRGGAAAIAFGTTPTLYVFGGTTADPSSVVRLAPGATSWTTAPALEMDVFAPAVGRIPSGRMVVYGGHDGNEPLADVLSYDHVIGDSHGGRNLTTERERLGYATDESLRPYALGGLDADGTVLASVERYTEATDTWSLVAPLPQGRFGFSAVSDGAGHLFTFGGATANNATSVSTTVYRYTIATNVWETMAPLPVAMRDSAATLGPNGKIYVVGGFSGTATLNLVQSYDLASNTWTTETTLPAAVRAPSAVIDSLGRLNVIGGLNASGQPLSSVWITQRLNQPDTVPVITSTPILSVAYGSPYTYRVTATGNPQPTFSLVTGPAGMTVDPFSGQFSWTPTPSQVGPNAVTVRASNFAGQVDQSFTVNLVATGPAITSAAPSTDPRYSPVVGYAYTHSVVATGNPAPTFSVVSGPAGLTINGSTGLISYTAAAGEAGSQPVTIRASNFVGQVDQSFTLNVQALPPDLTPPAAPTGVTVTGTTASSITLSWTAAVDDRGVASYKVYERRRTGFHGIKIVYSLVQSNITGTTATISGLSAGTSHTYAVSAVDTYGNESPRSGLASATTSRPPTLSYSGGTVTTPIRAIANHPLTFQLYSYGIPTPAVSLVSGPSSLTVTPTGLVSWTPTVSDIGTTTATFRAANTAGSTDLTLYISVLSDVPALSAVFNPGTGGQPYGVAQRPLAIQIVDASVTPSTFALVSAPNGMTIDSVTGLIAWAPVEADAGTATVTVRGTNSAGSTDYTFSFPIYFTGEVRNLSVSAIGSTSATLDWEAPTDAVGVAGHNITVSWVTGVGRTRRTHTLNYTSAGAGTSFVLTGLPASTTVTVRMHAFDTEGNSGLTNSYPVSFRTAPPTVPILGYTYPGERNAIVGQPYTLQLVDYYTLLPSTFSLVSGPAGLAVNPSTGLVTWTPTLADRGNAQAIFRAINSTGSTDITFNFYVHFTTAPLNLTASNIAQGATLNWSPPTDSTNVVKYKVVVSWRFNGHNYSRIEYTTGLETTRRVFVPSGGVLASVYVAALDAFGNESAASPKVQFVVP